MFFSFIFTKHISLARKLEKLYTFFKLDCMVFNSGKILFLSVGLVVHLMHLKKVCAMSTSTCSSVSFYSVKVIHSLISLNNWKRLSKFSKYRVMCTSSNPKILTQWLSLRKNCPYSELSWSAFSRIPTEYGEIL